MSAIEIRIDGVDITDDVVIKQASFQSMVNGSAGPARLRVKDVGQTYNFNTGDSLTLDVDSTRVWGGYVMGARKIYALAVIDTSPPYPLTRMWEITGADYNVLFNKRIVWKESDPTGKLNFRYDADTYDDTIIDDIFDNYLTIGGDGLTRTGVERIAKAILDVPGKTHHGSVASASYTWKQMMDRVARATGGVYYISPSKVLTYVDVETATSSYDLTDTPTDGNDIGYQSFTLLENGSDLVNDMFVWGAGTGSNAVVFSRTQDSASITAHNRWQLGLFTGGLFRQASADIIADSYVYGTPQSHRGGKDDAVSFTARVFEPVFTAGQVVDVSCGIFDYSDALPIRSMTVTFASPTEAIFDLVLGHLIDIPVGITEFRNFPPIDIDIDIDDRFPCPPGWIRSPSGQCIPPPIYPGGCDCDLPAAVYDSFTRTTTPGSSDPTHGFGTPSSGGQYWFTDGSDAPVYVNGTRGVIPFDVGGGSFSADADGTLPGPMWGGSFVQEMTWEYDTAVPGPVGDYEWTTFGAVVQGNDLAAGGLYIGNEVDDQPYLRVTYTPNGNPPDGVSDTLFITAPPTGTLIHFKWEHQQGVVIRAKYWEDGDPEPDWMVSAAIPFTPVLGERKFFSLQGDTSYAHTEYVDDIVFTMNRCGQVQFENFDRTVASPSWGVATSGHLWTVAARSNPSSTVSVGGSQGRMSWPTGVGGGAISMTSTDGPWTTGSYTMSTIFAVPSVAYAAFYIEFSTGPAGVTSDDANVAIVDFAGQVLQVYSDVPGGEFESFDLPLLGAGLYYFRWHHEPGVQSAAKVWAIDEVEPDWMVFRPAVVNAPIDSSTVFRVVTATGFGGGPSGAFTVPFDYIDFDYEGKPCYITDCEDRLNFPMEVLAKVRIAGTPDGNPTNLNFALSQSPAVGTAEVKGRLGLESTQVGASPINERMFLTGKGAFDGTAFTGVNDGTINDVFGDWLWIRLRLEAGMGVLGKFWQDGSSEPAAWTNSVGTYMPPYGLIDTLVITAALGTTYWEIAEVTVTGYGGVILTEVFTRTEASGWGDSEFGLPTGFNDWVHASGTASVTPGLAKLGPGTSSIYIQFPTCTTVDVDPGIGGPNTGPYCETIEHSGGTTFDTTRAFLELSLEVWVNGLQTTPVSSDGAAGQFVLAAITSSDFLRVCYQANGDPI